VTQTNTPKSDYLHNLAARILLWPSDITERWPKWARVLMLPIEFCWIIALMPLVGPLILLGLLVELVETA